jgi:low temperature requirement protein LtrA
VSTTSQQQEFSEVERASTLELFLDLVFVLTVTQLSHYVSHPDGLGTYGQALLMLTITWWMYDGYVWLTGNISMEPTLNRLAIFAAMGGYLWMAIAIPGAFGANAESASDTGLVFGLGFLLVIIIHIALFSRAPTSSAQAIWRLAPFNLGGALLVVAGGFVDPDWRWVPWVLAVLLMISSPPFLGLGAWTVSSAHYIERHGLVILIALGESVVAIGAGASGLEIDRSLVVTVLLALALSATMWWIYFDRDDQRAGEVMGASTGEGRPWLALWVAYAHLVMIGGIVVAAAGIENIVAHPHGAADTAGAWNLAAGLSIYVLGETWFRSLVTPGIPIKRIAVALLGLASVPVGLNVSGHAQLFVALGLMLVVILADAVSARENAPMR